MPVTGAAGFDGLRSEVCSRQPGGTWLPGVSDGAYWQLLTSAFTHVEIWHIGFNMLALWVLGPQLELAVGRVRFLALYLLSGSGRLARSSTGSPRSTRSTLGASGAIFGLMGALLVLALKVGGNVQQLLIWIGLNFVFTVRCRDISWQGHLGGFLGGALIAAVLVYAPRAAPHACGRPPASAPSSSPSSSASWSAPPSSPERPDARPGLAVAESAQMAPDPPSRRRWRPDPSSRRRCAPRSVAESAQMCAHGAMAVCRCRARESSPHLWTHLWRTTRL